MVQIDSRPAGTGYPLVFARGIARFDILRDVLIEKFHLPEDSIDDNLNYYRGIKTFLGAYGFKVCHTSIGFADDIDERAQQLGAQVNQILQREGCAKVHLIGHSMGGNDARHMIVDVPGMAEHVASLTTIGAPHFGTSLADEFLEHGGDEWIQRLGRIIHLEGFRDLTRRACAEFNARAQDAETKNPVVYQTYSGFADLPSVFMPLQLGWILLQDKEGANDGLVSVTSQAWTSQLRASDGTTKTIKQKQFPFPVDHLNECGWWEPHDREPGTGWGDLGQQIEAYELKIKQVYLEIAQSVAGIK